jgi:hypothetical protein
VSFHYLYQDLEQLQPKPQPDSYPSFESFGVKKNISNRHLNRAPTLIRRPELLHLGAPTRALIWSQDQLPACVPWLGNLRIKVQPFLRRGFEVHSRSSAAAACRRSHPSAAPLLPVTAVILLQRRRCLSPRSSLCSATHCRVRILILARCYPGKVTGGREGEDRAEEG